LYGNDIDTTTTPIQARLTWAIQKVRRPGGKREGNFIGQAKVFAQLTGDEKPASLRVGLIGLDKTPVRDTAPLFDQADNPIGHVTSGLPSPTLGVPIAMGYVTAAQAAIGTNVFAQVRGRAVPMRIASMPFVPTRYYRG
jgi:aminomethyltransferase